MMRKWFLVMLGLLALAVTARAQDAFNLPTELYVLTNSGVVQEYGVGAAGIRSVTPEGEFVLDFGVAPDGNWIAYRTEKGLTIQNLFAEDSYEIEGATAGIPPTRGAGDTVVWSPDGAVLVYTTVYGARAWFRQTEPPVFVDLREGQFRQLIWSPGGDYLAAEAEENIWWLYRREGNNLILTSAIPSSLGLAWVSPTEFIFAPADGSLIRMNLAQANLQTLLLDNTWVYSHPFHLPDGTLAVFGRQKDDAAVEPGFGRLLGLAVDSPKISNLGEAVVDLNGLRWAPGGELMVAFRGGVMALVIPTSGQGLTLPVADAVAYSWGPPPMERVSGLELPADGFFLAQDGNGIYQVWRLPRDGAPAEPLTSAAADVTAYALSPNGRAIAYASGGSIQVQPTSGGDAETIAEPGEREVRTIAFSADARQIAYDTNPASSEPEAGVWLVPADGSGEAELILRNGTETVPEQPPFYRQPQFAPTTAALLAVASQGEGMRFTLLDLQSREAFDVGAYDEAFWLRDGRILAYGGGAGIGDPPPSQPVVIVDPATAQRTELTAIQFPARIEFAREIAPGQVRLGLSSSTRGPNAFNLVDLETAGGSLKPVGNGGFITAPVLSPDGRWLAGATHPDGPLTLRDLQSGRQVILADFPSVKAFQWSSQR